MCMDNDILLIQKSGNKMLPDSSHWFKKWLVSFQCQAISRNDLSPFSVMSFLESMVTFSLNKAHICSLITLKLRTVGSQHWLGKKNIACFSGTLKKKFGCGDIFSSQNIFSSLIVARVHFFLYIFSHFRFSFIFNFLSHIGILCGFEMWLVMWGKERQHLQDKTNLLAST